MAFYDYGTAGNWTVTGLGTTAQLTAGSTTTQDGRSAVYLDGTAAQINGFSVNATTTSVKIRGYIQAYSTVAPSSSYSTELAGSGSTRYVNTTNITVSPSQTVELRQYYNGSGASTGSLWSQGSGLSTARYSFATYSAGSTAYTHARVSMAGGGTVYFTGDADFGTVYSSMTGELVVSSPNATDRTTTAFYMGTAGGARTGLGPVTLNGTLYNAGTASSGGASFVRFHGSAAGYTNTAPYAYGGTPVALYVASSGYHAELDGVAGSPGFTMGTRYYGGADSGRYLGMTAYVNPTVDGAGEDLVIKTKLGGWYDGSDTPVLPRYFDKYGLGGMTILAEFKSSYNATNLGAARIYEGSARLAASSVVTNSYFLVASGASLTLENTTANVLSGVSSFSMGGTLTLPATITSSFASSMTLNGNGTIYLKGTGQRQFVSTAATAGPTGASTLTIDSDGTAGASFLWDAPLSGPFDALVLKVPTIIQGAATAWGTGTGGVGKIKIDTGGSLAFGAAVTTATIPPIEGSGNITLPTTSLTMDVSGTGGATVTYGGVLSNSGANASALTIAKASTNVTSLGGTVVLSNNQAYTGLTTVSGGAGAKFNGTLQTSGLTVTGGSVELGVTNTLKANAPLIISTAASAIVTTKAANTMGTVTPGTVTLTLGTYDIGATNQRTGAFTFNSGVLTGTTGKLSPASMSVANAAAAPVTLDVILAGTTGVSKSGTGVLTVADVNEHTGKWQIAAGSVAITTDRNLGAVPATATSDYITFSANTLLTVNDDTTIHANRGITSTGTSAGATTTIGDAATTAGLNIAAGKTVTYGGSISGATFFGVRGTGTLKLTGQSTSTGSLYLSGGTIEVATVGAVGTTSHALPPGPNAGRVALNVHGTGSTLVITGDGAQSTDRGLYFQDSGRSVNIVYRGLGGLTWTNSAVAAGGLLANYSMGAYGSYPRTINVNVENALSTVNWGFSIPASFNNENQVVAKYGPGKMYLRSYNGGYGGIEIYEGEVIADDIAHSPVGRLYLALKNPGTVFRAYNPSTAVTFRGIATSITAVAGSTIDLAAGYVMAMEVSGSAVWDSYAKITGAGIVRANGSNDVRLGGGTETSDFTGGVEIYSNSTSTATTVTARDASAFGTGPLKFAPNGYSWAYVDATTSMTITNPVYVYGGMRKAATDVVLTLSNIASYNNSPTAMSVNGGRLKVAGNFNDAAKPAFGITMSTGAGVLELAGTNTYTGLTSLVSGSKLWVTGSIASKATIANGAYVDGTGTIGDLVTVSAMGTTVAPIRAGTDTGAGNLTLAGGLTFAATSGTNVKGLQITKAKSADDTSAIVITGGTVTSAAAVTMTVDLIGDGFIPGQDYSVITPGPGIDIRSANQATYTAGTLTQPNPRVTGFTVKPKDTAVNGAVTLTVLGQTKSVSWRGGVTGNLYSAATGFVTTGTTTADTIYHGDTAVFDGASPGNVTLTDDLAVGGISVDSSADYTFVASGAFKLYGGSLSGITKAGTGTATFNVLNALRGAVAHNGGTLAVGYQDGLGTGTVTMASGAILRGTASVSLRNAVASNAAHTVSADNGTVLTMTGTFSGTGALTKAGAGTLYLSRTAANGRTGTLTVNEGTLKTNHANGLGVTTSSNLNVTMAAGTTLHSTVTGNVPALTLNKLTIGGANVVLKIG